MQLRQKVGRTDRVVLLGTRLKTATKNQLGFSEEILAEAN